MTPEELNSLKNQGFVVTTNSDPDFFESLSNKFFASNPHMSKPANKKLREGVSAFVAFCREALSENPPIATTYLDNGLAFQFSDYTRVVLVHNKATQDRPTAVAINTYDKPNPGPVTFKQVDTSVPITR